MDLLRFIFSSAQDIKKSFIGPLNVQSVLEPVKTPGELTPPCYSSLGQRI